ncbi:MAG: hypothetical protein H0U86_03690 [Chloroflexi bacterium]|nr:hypothetical protein [Chloroflexota bacterium]
MTIPKRALRRAAAALAVGVVVLSASACGLVEQLFVGPNDARWGHAADAEIGPDTIEFVAMVTETVCASGRSSEGRIIGPDIAYTDEAVTITFAVRPLGGGAQDCPGNPSTPVMVRLDEPLGDRALLDGGTDPPREPPVCQNPDFCD